MLTRRILTLPLFRPFGTVVKPNLLTQGYEQEMVEFKIKMKEARKEHTKKHWDLQAQIENNYIAEYEAAKKLKTINDNTRERTSIIKNAFKCYQNIVFS